MIYSTIWESKGIKGRAERLEKSLAVVDKSEPSRRSEKLGISSCYNRTVKGGCQSGANVCQQGWKMERQARYRVEERKYWNPLGASLPLSLTVSNLK